jgi:hypothetical protein
MEIGLKILTNNCPICGKERNYKTLQGLTRANEKQLPCRSCTNSIIRGGIGKVYNSNNERYCPDCKKYLNLENFHYIPSKNRYHSICKECAIIKSQNYHFNIYRYEKYNITKKDFEYLLGLQDNKCAICEKNLTNIKINIDHDHKTGKVRGLLCSDCNLGLGQFKDSKEIIKKAYKYLDDK